MALVHTISLHIIYVDDTDIATHNIIFNNSTTQSMEETYFNFSTYNFEYLSLNNMIVQLSSFCRAPGVGCLAHNPNHCNMPGLLSADNTSKLTVAIHVCTHPSRAGP